MARSRARKAKAQRREAQQRRKAQWKAQGEAWQEGYSHKVIGTTQRRNFMVRSRPRTARRKVYSRHRTLEEKYPIQEDKEQKHDALDYAVSGGHFESNRRKH